MKLLVIGSGGREHALVWKLAKSPHVTQLWCAPGNAGIGLERLATNAALVENVNISAEDLPKLLAFAQEKRVDFTVVGPDNPLALGIVDLFQKHGLKIWGVNQKAAQFESSKVFSQKFMEKYGIPTAAAGTFSDVVAAKRFTATLGGKCVVKADGLALGKGVLICANQAEAERCYRQADKWITKNAPQTQYLLRLRDQAATLIGITAATSPSPSTAPADSRSPVR